MIFKRFKLWQMERRWEKYGRKEAFTWVHRYLRLHSELLEDPIYRDMYNYHRATLVAYMRRDHKNKKSTDEERGKLVDVLADLFNKSSADRVNAYKPLVDVLYDDWGNMSDEMKEVRI